MNAPNAEISNNQFDPEGVFDAPQDLFPVVYDELRRIARAEVRRLPAGQTLQATALVHEVWLRLAQHENLVCNDRAHFFGSSGNSGMRMAGKATRTILRVFNAFEIGECLAAQSNYRPAGWMGRVSGRDG